jgi:hypothetical protein
MEIGVSAVDNSEYSCLNCVELVSQLEEICKELSSSQLIIKLLHKEINDITTKKTYKPPDTTTKLALIFLLFSSVLLHSNTWTSHSAIQVNKTNLQSYKHTTNICYDHKKYYKYNI